MEAKQNIRKNGKHFFVSSFGYCKDFWRDMESGSWEPDTYSIFEEFLSERYSYIDIGAWIGPTALYGCQLSRHCYAVEPDPIAFGIFMKNIDLNPELKNILTPYEVAIWSTSGYVNLGTRTSYGDSMSSVAFQSPKEFRSVKSIRLDEFVKTHNINDCNFIKMDIEGGEEILLPSMKDYFWEKRPALLISFHPYLFNNAEKNAKAIIDSLSLYKNICYTNGILLRSEEFFLKLCCKRGFSVVVTDNWNYFKRFLYILKFNTKTYIRFKMFIAQILFSRYPKFYSFLKNQTRFLNIVKK
ncbi:MAG: FkbM family methyltransferase [Candidatus Omnitrophota bacterium]